MTRTANAASAEIHRKLFEVLVMNEPLLPIGTPGMTSADLTAGGNNEQQAYVDNPNLISVAEFTAEFLFAAINNQYQNQDVPILTSFDIKDATTFESGGQLKGLHNQGIFIRMCHLQLTASNLQTGTGPLGIIPIDSLDEKGDLIGNGLAKWMIAKLDGLVGGQLSKAKYHKFYTYRLRGCPRPQDSDCGAAAC